MIRSLRSGWFAEIQAAGQQTQQQAAGNGTSISGETGLVIDEMLTMAPPMAVWQDPMYLEPAWLADQFYLN
jgi:hypothetical protein